MAPFLTKSIEVEIQETRNICILIEQRIIACEFNVSYTSKVHRYLDYFINSYVCQTRPLSVYFMFLLFAILQTY
jgi:hypothetical protein